MSLQITSLPDEVIYQVFEFCQQDKNLKNMRLVSKDFERIATNLFNRCVGYISLFPADATRMIEFKKEKYGFQKGIYTFVEVHIKSERDYGNFMSKADKDLTNMTFLPAKLFIGKKEGDLVTYTLKNKTINLICKQRDSQFDDEFGLANYKVETLPFETMLKIQLASRCFTKEGYSLSLREQRAIAKQDLDEHVRILKN